MRFLHILFDGGGVLVVNTEEIVFLKYSDKGPGIIKFGDSRPETLEMPSSKVRDLHTWLTGPMLRDWYISYTIDLRTPPLVQEAPHA